MKIEICLILTLFLIFANALTYGDSQVSTLSGRGRRGLRGSRRAIVTTNNWSVRGRGRGVNNKACCDKVTITKAITNVNTVNTSANTGNMITNTGNTITNTGTNNTISENSNRGVRSVINTFPANETNSGLLNDTNFQETTNSVSSNRGNIVNTNSNITNFETINSATNRGIINTNINTAVNTNTTLENITNSNINRGAEEEDSETAEEEDTSQGEETQNSENTSVKNKSDSNTGVINTSDRGAGADSSYGN